FFLMNRMDDQVRRKLEHRPIVHGRRVRDLHQPGRAVLALLAHREQSHPRDGPRLGVLAPVNAQPLNLITPLRRGTSWQRDAGRHGEGKSSTHATTLAQHRKLLRFTTFASMTAAPSRVSSPTSWRTLTSVCGTRARVAALQSPRPPSGPPPSTLSRRN